MKLKSYSIILSSIFICISFIATAQDLQPEKIKERTVFTTETESSNIHQTILNNETSSSRLAPPSNDDCADAIPLTVGDPCVSGTTIDGSIEAGEDTTCNAPPDQSVWYSFVATQADMYVTVDRTASSGCYLGSSVFSNGCLPGTELNCEDISGGPLMNIHNLTGLTAGDTYYIRVIYNTTLGGCGGGPPGSRGADFCLRVGETEDCSSCSSPCGPACGFSSTPTVAQVTSSCPEYDLHAPLNENQSNTYCYTFTANNSTVTMGMIANTRGCTGGTVYGATWTVQGSGCGPVLDSGDLSNTTMTGLTVGQDYTYCYTPTAACLRLSQYPYFVGAVPLPIELVSFQAKVANKAVIVEWTTASELNNEWFELERSFDANKFEPVGKIRGAINSTQILEYAYTDIINKSGTIYYRLKQIDLNGSFTYSDLTTVNITPLSNIELYPNPSRGIFSVEYISTQNNDLLIKVYNSKAELIESRSMAAKKGSNRKKVDLKHLDKGIYFIQIIGETDQFTEKLVLLQ